MDNITEFNFDVWIARGAYILLFSTMLVIARLLKGLFIKDNVNKELTDKDNLAYSISISGYFMGVAIIFFGANIGASNGLVNDLISVGIYAFGGILALFVSRLINDFMIFNQVDNMKEIIDNKNVSVGIVQFGTYVATGLMIASSVSGDTGGWEETLLFFIFGQAFLVSYVKGYIKFSRFHIQDDIKNNNVAVALSVTGKIIAIGLIIMVTLSHEFIGWKETFVTMFIDCSILTVLLFISTYLFDKVIIPKSALYHELVNEKNTGVGLMDGLFAILFAVLMFFCF
ncbi:DUF350 domain-containing protein [Flammeovirga pacifica]|uniref:DUF350 domain-containing protein n=1 Tax=Flammeovirga pacifica TaxID=915059 RepID=A0A1S1YYN8_FLAPC|nr:DUF350 domain-containing protein [Flammeovirga pacifica]OHX66117.1 hypothetical protein NH26_07015 [Flammeovirga pacifica]